MQELGHETALLSHINHGFGSIACTLLGREIWEDACFCFCFFFFLPGVSMPARHCMQLMRLWVCWMGLLPLSAPCGAEPEM